MATSKQILELEVEKTAIERSIDWLEYLGGAKNLPPEPAKQLPAWFWGIWWALLLVMAIAFSGQASKFIYIDF